VSPAAADTGALPKIIIPPHNPFLSSVELLPLFCPGTISSKTEVKIIGWLAVPCAIIFPPRATISAEAKEPLPSFPLIIVPACMVSVMPSGTTTFPFKV